MLYDRKIKYLDYLENGQRIQGAGYVKLERRDEELKLELAVTGLRVMDSCERDVLVCGAGEAKGVGKIVISGGRGQWKQLFRNPKDIGGTGISYEELQGIRVSVGAGREIAGSWQSEGGRESEAVQEERRRRFEKKEKREAPENRVTQKDAKGRRDGEDGWTAGVRGKSRTALDEKAGQNKSMILEEESGRKSRAGADEEIGRKNSITLGEEAEQENRRVSGERSDREGHAPLEEKFNRESRTNWNEEGGRKDRMASEEEGRRKNGETAAAAISGLKPKTGGGVRAFRGAAGERGRGETEKPVRLLEDKWQQLWSIYPHIKPFRDEREYLSIGPSDFVLFSAASYRMVNNSFLLHGYYNYHHLILARLESKGETVYYVGVPGSYFEKEKQVAIMFGFESFECAEEPAQPGDFGYYMMRAQL